MHATDNDKSQRQGLKSQRQEGKEREESAGRELCLTTAPVGAESSRHMVSSGI